MKEEMKRGRSQVIWRYAPGAMFRYNETGGWCTTATVTIQKAGPLQGALAKAIAQSLRRWNAIGASGFPDPQTQAARYIVGEPFQVMYTLWPTVFTCRECGRVYFYQQLSNLQHTNELLRCRLCKGRDQFRQVPYAYVCECGRLDSVYIPSTVPGLTGHTRDHFIELINRGSFQDSFWRCRDCHRPLYRNPREGLGFRRCECAPKKGKRGVLLEDSRIFYSQTLDLVDIEPKILDKWKENTRFSDLLLGAMLRVPAYDSHHLLDLAAWKPGQTDDLSPELRHMKTMLMKDMGLSEQQADAMVRKSAQQGSANPWTAYDRDLAPYRGTVGALPWAESRRAVEYVFVRDEPSVNAISLRSLITETAASGDQASSQRLQEEEKLAAKLGLTELRIVQALPILLAGFGYTRYFSNPQDKDGSGTSNTGAVVLRTYPDVEGKIPVYVARNTTEALLYELDPWRVAAFLEMNSGLGPTQDDTKSEPSLRSWLLAQSVRLVTLGESHFVLKSYETEAGLTVDAPSALLFGVLHTFSHVLKATAHRYVGIDADSQAEYLFPAQTAGLLYVSSHVEFTLGGMDSVFRSNLTQWLASVQDYAGQCSFDPVCRHSGGACLACLYPKFGCGYFNRTVSRSFLVGGEIAGRSQPVIGFWDRRVIERARHLSGSAIKIAQV